MKDIKEYIVNESKVSLHRTWPQIEVVLKNALVGIKNGKEPNNDMMAYEDWESASDAIGTLLRDAADAKQAQQIIEYIIKNY
jgi:hypothetical protein